MTFEDSLDRLETIVTELDGDALELDTALALFEEGLAKLRSAAVELDRAEAQVKLLVENADGSFDLADFKSRSE